jgi:hypothetical protein
VNSVFKFMLRKVIYVGLATGTAATAAYLTGHPDISDWTLKGAAISAGTAAWGAILSNVLGGSMTKQ